MTPERPVRFVPLVQPPSRHDLLYWLVDAALCAALLDGTPDDAPFAWDEAAHPRDYRGRWASGAGGGLSAADREKGRADARAAVDAFLKAGHPATDAEVKALAGHLARLTVAQLHELRRDYGLKGASALRKGELTDRLHQHVREARKNLSAPVDKASASAYNTPGVEAQGSGEGGKMTTDKPRVSRAEAADHIADALASEGYRASAWTAGNEVRVYLKDAKGRPLGHLRITHEGTVEPVLERQKGSVMASLPELDIEPLASPAGRPAVNWPVAGGPAGDDFPPASPLPAVATVEDAARRQTDYQNAHLTPEELAARRAANAPAAPRAVEGRAMTHNVADHPAVVPLARLAKKDAYGSTLTVPVTVGFEKITKGPNAGKWDRGDFGPQLSSQTEPDRKRAVGDVSETPGETTHTVRIAVPHAFGTAGHEVRQAVRAALPELQKIAEERFLAAHPGAEFYVPKGR